MSASDFSDVVTVVAGPNQTPGTFRTGDTDGYYWVRGQVEQHNEWLGPYATAIQADAAARKSITTNYLTDIDFDCQLWTEWGKRYWRANGGAGNGGKWLLIPEGCYCYVPTLVGDDAPEVYQYGSISFATYAAINNFYTNPLIGPEHTDLAQGLGGKNTAISVKNRQRDIVGRIPIFSNIPGLAPIPTYYSQEADALAVNLTPYIASAESQLPIAYAEMRVVQHSSMNRLVYKADLYSGCTVATSAVNYTWPDDYTADVYLRKYVTGVGFSSTTSIPVGEWVNISGPAHHVFPYEYDGNRPAGILVDASCSVTDVIYKYRAVYSDGSKSVWHTDTSFFTYCNTVGGPFLFMSEDPNGGGPYGRVGVKVQGVYHGNSDTVAEGFSGPVEYTFPMPPGSDYWAGFCFDCCEQTNSSVGPGKSFRIIASDNNGKLIYSQPFGAYGTFDAAVIWKKSASDYANGATINEYEQGPTFGWRGLNPANQFLPEFNSFPKFVHTPSRSEHLLNGLIKTDSAGHSLTYANDGTGTGACHIDTVLPDSTPIDRQGPYPSFALGVIDVYFSDDGRSYELQGYQNANVEVAINDSKLNPNALAFWEDYGANILLSGGKGNTVLADLSAPPGKIVVAFDTSETLQLGGASSITYYGPHYATGPQRYYTNTDINLVGLKSTSALSPTDAPTPAPFALLGVTNGEPVVASLAVTDTNGFTQTVNLYAHPPGVTRINVT